MLKFDDLFGEVKLIFDAEYKQKQLSETRTKSMEPAHVFGLSYDDKRAKCEICGDRTGWFFLTQTSPHKTCSVECLNELFALENLNDSNYDDFLFNFEENKKHVRSYLDSIPDWEYSPHYVIPKRKEVKNKTNVQTEYISPSIPDQEIFADFDKSANILNSTEKEDKTLEKKHGIADEKLQSFFQF
jgi:hypothetical protein